MMITCAFCHTTRTSSCEDCAQTVSADSLLVMLTLVPECCFLVWSCNLYRVIFPLLDMLLLISSIGCRGSYFSACMPQKMFA